MSDAWSPRPSGSKLTQRLLIALVGVGMLAAAAYLTLVIVTRVDNLLFPGRSISVGVPLPGVEEGENGLEGRINILVMGLDRRPNEGDAPTRTDTLFLVTVDPQTKTAKLLGIPRDWWVEIPYRSGSGYYNDRVNTAYVIGETEDYSGGGVGLVKQVLEHNLDLDRLGISIDHHVIIDFESFVGLIDELGGIDVYVPEPVDDPTYSHTEIRGDYFPLHFEVGMHHMDGITALGYARTRFDSSDLDRIQRQQRVIFAAIDKAAQLDLLRPDKLADLWGEFEDTIKTDVNDLQVPGFADLAAQIDETNIQAWSIGVAMVNYTTTDGASVLLADEDLVQQMVDIVFSDQVLLGEEALVEVQNGTGADGMAGKAVDYLSGFGFSADQLVAESSIDGQVRPLTEIVDFTGKQETRARIAELFGVTPDRVRVAGPNDATLRHGSADIVVILGADAQEKPFAQDTSQAAGG